jgi:signal peptidase I
MKLPFMNASAPASAATPAPATPASAAPAKHTREEGARDTIEAVVIAFILAFVFKTFEAEAFVIPTGSMAPTLYGRHKEVTCTGCGLNYTIGASQEIDQDSGALRSRIQNSICPNCRYLNLVESAPVFNGDRIVVNKQVAEYRRYDVVVFKYPEEPYINYIKRLVGLPGETIRIRQGDIYARKSDSEPFQIQRKQDPQKQLDTQILVYDDRTPPTPLLKAGGQERWSPAINQPANRNSGGWPAAENAWTPNPETRTYSVAAPPGPPQWLRYRHLIPTAEQWNEAAESRDLSSPLLPHIVTDFCGFNAEDENQELYWTNDLTLEFNLELLEVRENARLILELEEGFRTVRCELDPHTGNITLSAITHTNAPANPPQPETLAVGVCSINQPGEYLLAFANVDDQPRLWVNGSIVPLNVERELNTPDLNLPTDRDLAPVGIAAHGLKASLNSLVLKRDIYYRNDIVAFRPASGSTADPASASYGFEYGESVAHEVNHDRASQLTRCFRSPEAWGTLYSELVKQQELRYGSLLELPLAEDEYLMLGDNSPASKDGRLFDFYSRPARNIFSNRHAVRQSDLVGEAMFIFWPHAIPFLNNGRGFSIIGHKGDKEYPLYSIPFYPNLSRMKSIH